MMNGMTIRVPVQPCFIYWVTNIILSTLDTTNTQAVPQHIVTIPYRRNLNSVGINRFMKLKNLNKNIAVVMY